MTKRKNLLATVAVIDRDTAPLLKQYGDIKTNIDRAERDISASLLEKMVDPLLQQLLDAFAVHGKINPNWALRPFLDSLLSRLRTSEKERPDRDRAERLLAPHLK